MAFLTGYTKRKKITIDNTKVDATLTDFPVRVYLNADTDIGAVSNADGYDIRFTSSDGTTLLKYEREDFAISGGAATGNFWVKVPSVSSSADTEIYIYYRATDTADGADPTNVWDSNFKARYSMKDLTTSTIEDSTPNSSDGTKLSANNPEEVDGKIGKGQDFSTDYITLTNSQNAAEGTFEALVNWDTVDGASRPVVADDGAGYFVMTLNQGSDTDNKVLFQTYDTSARWAKGTTTPTAGVWYYCVGCWKSGEKTKIYINGEKEGESSSNASNIGNTATPLRLGKWSSYHFDGKQDEVRISNVQRSASWIKATYNSNFGTLLSLGAEETATSGLNMQVKIGSAWKNVSSAQVKIGNNWKNVSGVQIKIGNNWKNV